MGNKQIEKNKEILGDLRGKYTQFETRPSLFDDLFQHSWISTTPFRGFFNLIIFLLTFGIALDAGVNLVMKGRWFELELLEKMFETLEYLALCWISLITYSVTALILQKCLLMGFPRIIIIFLQHLTQSVAFIYIIYIIYITRWIKTHYLVIGCLLCVIYFKMHSYTATNLQLNKIYKNNLLYQKTVASSHQDYPNNINLMNYIRYMITPTFVYKTEYPRTGGIKWKYFLSKLLLSILLVIKAYQIITTHILPVIENHSKHTFITMYLQLCLPISLICILSLFIMFDCSCNMLAELSSFADRQFYTDWWNSTNIEEFMERINTLTHRFFGNYVYCDLLAWGAPRWIAKLCALLFSLILLEMVMGLIFGFPRLYLMCAVILGYPVHKALDLVKSYTFRNYAFLFLYLYEGSFLIMLYITDYIHLNMQ